MSRGLTEAQERALRWIDEKPHHYAGWQTNGSEAHGPPENWDAIKLRGRLGSIVIKKSDWRAICELIDGAPESDDPRMFVLNHAGRSALDLEGRGDG